MAMAGKAGIEETVVKVAAPGKLILHGEHSVVYGKRAIALSVNLCTTITISHHRSHSGVTRLIFPDVDIDTDIPVAELKGLLGELGPHFTFAELTATPEIPIEPRIQSILEKFLETKVQLPECKDPNLKPAQRAALAAFLFMYLGIFGGQEEELEGMSVSVETELPVGAGLGSSASFGVSLAGALLQAAGKLRGGGAEGGPPLGEADLNFVNRWAFVSEKFVHGSPSGVDNTVATFGRGVIFRKGEPYQLVQCSDIRVLLVNTKVARSTKALVAKVKELQDTNPSLHTQLIDGIESVVESAINEIQVKGQVSGQLVEQNQHLLAQLGVSHPSLDEIIKLAKDGYSLDGKLSGAGGGGCAFILLPPNSTPDEKVKALRDELHGKGFESWDTKLGCEGFRIL